jgi:methyl-accepting chemotaxis protein
VNRLLQYDAAEIKSISGQLKDLSGSIASWTPDSTEPLFDASLFEATTRILAPIALFPSTIEGISRFSDAVGLSIRAVNTPLKKAFHKPIIGKPITAPEEVSAGVNALIERIQEYFSHIDQVTNDVDTLIQHLGAVASDSLLISQGIEDFASGKSQDNPVDDASAMSAWNAARSDAEGYVSAVVGKTRAAKLLLVK